MVDLRCEYLNNPLGIDVARPQLNWKIADVQSKTTNQKSEMPRAVRQTAYQVLVASSEKLLKEGKADLWDSGRVESGQSVNVEYKGKELESLVICHWKVSVGT